MSPKPQQSDNNSESLTPRETEVLKLIASGLSTKQIALTLGITFKTASCHRFRLMEKLGIHDVASLTRYAVRYGYVRLWDEEPPAKRKELFEQVRTTGAELQRVMREYADFLKERPTIGVGSPDGVTGRQKLRAAEKAAYEKYYAALVALKQLLISGSDKSRS
jgi:DNA-binding CsgD family transcriptional regulator